MKEKAKTFQNITENIALQAAYAVILVKSPMTSSCRRAPAVAGTQTGITYIVVYFAGMEINGV